MLFVAVCFEGLGRKFLPQVPSVVFYFLKDAALVLGLLLFGVRKEVKDFTSQIMGPWRPIVWLGVVFTVVQIANPGNPSLALGVLGLRAYWFWWLAPMLIASLMHDPRTTRWILLSLAFLTVFICLFGAYQFARPASDSLNTNALYEGRETNDVDVVGTTGRVRVSATFSYLSGFAGFNQIMPMVFLALGLRFQGRVKQLCLLAAFGGAATLPMSGSRGAVLSGAANLFAVIWGAGFLRTRAGRRLIAAGVVAVAASFVVVPDAMQGVADRFAARKETAARLDEAWAFLPPVALIQLGYPLLGVGTGTQQNASGAMGVVNRQYYSEGEAGKTLIELGPLGYLLVWATHLGLTVVLLQATRFLRRSGRGAEAGVALALAFMAQTGRLVFDHVYQALYFFCLGLILHIVVETRRTLVASPKVPNTRAAPRGKSSPLAAPSPGREPVTIAPGTRVPGAPALPLRRSSRPV
jgi:hypothetical protein